MCRRGYLYAIALRMRERITKNSWWRFAHSSDLRGSARKWFQILVPSSARLVFENLKLFFYPRMGLVSAWVFCGSWLAPHTLLRSSDKKACSAGFRMKNQYIAVHNSLISSLQVLYQAQKATSQISPMYSSQRAAQAFTVNVFLLSL